MVEKRRRRNTRTNTNKGQFLILNLFTEVLVAQTMHMIFDSMGYLFERTHGISGAEYIIEHNKPQCIILNLFDMSTGVKQKHIHASSPNDYEGFVWAKDVIARHPELRGRIIILSSFLNWSDDRDKFYNAFPDADSQGIFLIPTERFEDPDIGLFSTVSRIEALPSI